jgi:hypothetical protein
VRTRVVAEASGFHASALPQFFPDRFAPAYVRELEAFADAEGRVVRLDEIR